MMSLTIEKVITRIHAMTSFETIVAIIACVAALAIGKYLADLTRKIKPTPTSTSFLQSISSLLWPFITLVILFCTLFVLVYIKENPIVTVFLIRISVAWLVTALILLLTSRRSAGWIIAIFVIPITVLSVFHILEPLIHYLDDVVFTVGKHNFSLYQILKTIFTVVILLYIAKFVTKFGEMRLQKIDRLKTSDRTLILKTIQILAYVVIAFITLDLLDINVATLAVFSGAIGVGLGFGLQKITSNFISGIILLFEKSVEVGDLIELNDGTNGVIKRMGARYTLIETSQGKEVLVPNEDFITQRVTNWTYSHHKGRIEIPISVSYDADLNLARKIALEAARNNQYCLKDPEPQCFLQTFGESAINFLLTFWIDDVAQGRSKPQSDIMFEIWRKFKEHKIEMPYPQRDLHIKSPVNIVNLSQEKR